MYFISLVINDFLSIWVNMNGGIVEGINNLNLYCHIKYQYKDLK